MYREDDKPWRYLNVPGARKRNVSPQKIMRRMSLTATGRFVERIGGVVLFCLFVLFVWLVVCFVGCLFVCLLFVVIGVMLMCVCI
jgi:Flp pilus assembly protein TadB